MGLYLLYLVCIARAGWCKGSIIMEPSSTEMPSPPEPPWVSATASDTSLAIMVSYWSWMWTPSMEIDSISSTLHDDLEVLQTVVQSEFSSSSNGSASSSSNSNGNNSISSNIDNSRSTSNSNVGWSSVRGNSSSSSSSSSNNSSSSSSSSSINSNGNASRKSRKTTALGESFTLTGCNTEASSTEFPSPPGPAWVHATPSDTSLAIMVSYWSWMWTPSAKLGSVWSASHPESTQTPVIEAPSSTVHYLPAAAESAALRWSSRCIQPIATLGMTLAHNISLPVYKRTISQSIAFNYLQGISSDTLTSSPNKSHVTSHADDVTSSTVDFNVLNVTSDAHADLTMNVPSIEPSFTVT